MNLKKNCLFFWLFFKLGNPLYNTVYNGWSISQEIAWFLWSTAWWPLRFTPDTWRAARGSQGCALFRLPFVTALTACPDVMHCKYLGTDKYAYGSVLFILVFLLLPGSIADNVATVWNFIKHFYKDNNYNARGLKAYTSFRLGMFCRAKAPRSVYPALKGRAAELKHVGPALLALWKAHMTSAMEHVMVLLALTNCVNMDELVDKQPAESPWKMDSHDATLYLQAAWEYGSAISWLGQHYAAKGERLFDLTVKHHLLAHCAHYARYLHPKLSWCFLMRTIWLWRGGCCDHVPLGPSLMLQTRRWWSNGCTGHIHIGCQTVYLCLEPLLDMMLGKYWEKHRLLHACSCEHISSTVVAKAISYTDLRTQFLQVLQILQGL